jgi:hypothetical protein
VSGMVHVLERVQLVYQEVQQRAPRRARAVDLACLVDGDGGLLAERHLLANLGRGALRLLEVLDQLDVLQDVALGVGQPHEQVVLEVRQLHLVVVLGLDQPRSLCHQPTHKSVHPNAFGAVER